MKVAIRDDDTSYFTKPKDLQRAYDFLNEDDCVSLSVVPYTVPVHRDDVFPYGKEIGMGYYDIAENTELLEYLKKKYKQGKVDILLHGYSHEYQLSENKWLAEMKWKSSSQLKEEIPKGKTAFYCITTRYRNTYNYSTENNKQCTAPEQAMCHGLRYYVPGINK